MSNWYVDNFSHLDEWKSKVDWQGLSIIEACNTALLHDNSQLPHPYRLDGRTIDSNLEDTLIAYLPQSRKIMKPIVYGLDGTPLLVQKFTPLRAIQKLSQLPHEMYLCQTNLVYAMKLLDYELCDGEREQDVAILAYMKNPDKHLADKFKGFRIFEKPYVEFDPDFEVKKSK